MNKFPSIIEVQKVKEKFPSGARVSMVEMKNDPCPIVKGTQGTVLGVDDLGTLRVKWDDGRTLGVCVLDGDIVKRILDA